MPILRKTLAFALLAALAPLHADSEPEHNDPAHLDTVEVTGQQARGYHADTSQLDTFGSFGNAPLQDTPATISVITRDQLDDRQPRTLSELVRSDAGVGDSYAPVGYFQNISIRGFPLDFSTSYRLNGLSMVGEQRISLEDMQRVEILKGLGGLQAGVLAPGGMVNYVSKRPANVRGFTLGTDSHGSRHLAADLGRWLSPAFGVRVNVAHEDIHSWVEHADGWRSLLALAADWKPASGTTLQFDSNFQKSSQRSVSGYQLLGGTALPARVDRSHLLGYQPWQRPVGMRSHNTSLRLEQRLGSQWIAQLAAGYSHSVIDDYVAFAYGCFYAPECADGSHPGWFFAPNGDYDVYDYRNPDDTRINREARAVLSGAFDTGPVSHELTFGAGTLRRTVDRHASLNEYVGTTSIFDPEVPVFAPSPKAPGPKVRRLESDQVSVFVLDRLHLGEHWQLLAGARRVRLDEQAWDKRGNLERDSRPTRTLPQAALMWQPDARTTAYLSYSENLSLGAEAPFWTSNEGEILAPRVARQSELGIKYAHSRDLNLTAALYRLRQPWQFAFPDDTPAGFTFAERGSETREGVELSAAGQVSERLRLVASVNWVQARGRNAGTPAVEGHQLVNVPRLRTAAHLDWRLPTTADLSVLAGWRHAGENTATADGHLRVPAWHVFDAGLRYRQRWNGNELVWRLTVDNLFDRFYWSDTGSSLGDSYLFPGAPRLARMSLSFGF